MKNYTQLTLKERETIFEMKQSGKKNTEIAKEIKRHESTISRELRCNRYNDAIEYTPDKAHNMAKKRKYVLVRKLEKDKKLNDFIIEKLKMKWSPDVIAAESKKSMATTITTETIYSYIYFDAEKKSSFEAKKRPPLYLFLASMRSKRNQRGARKI